MKVVLNVSFFISNNLLKQKPTTLVVIPQQKVNVSIIDLPLSINCNLLKTMAVVTGWRGQ